MTGKVIPESFIIIIPPGEEGVFRHPSLPMRFERRSGPSHRFDLTHLSIDSFFSVAIRTG